MLLKYGQKCWFNSILQINFDVYYFLFSLYRTGMQGCGYHDSINEGSGFRRVG